VLRSAWSISLEAIPTVARRRRAVRGTVAGVALAGVVALAATQPWRGTATDDAGALGRSGWRDSVAVLPLRNRTGDAQFDHVATGLSSLVADNITRVPWVKVISGRTTEAWVDSTLPSRQLGDSLDARLLVFGSLTSLGDGRIRIDVEIADGPTNSRRGGIDTVVFGDSVAGAEPAVAHAVIRSLFRQVSAPEDMIPAVGLAKGPEHALYVDAQRALRRRTPEGIRESIRLYEEALRRNPRYAPALAGLSSAFALSLTYRYRLDVDPYTAAGRALSLAREAVEEDPELAAGYSARGYIAALVGGPEDLIVEDFQRARALQPSNADVPSWSARALAQRGEMREALRQARTAVALEPASASRRIALAGWALQEGSLDESIAAAERAIALEPSLALSRSVLGLALLLDGQAERCASTDLGPHVVIRAMCLAESGRADSAAAIVANVERMIGAAARPDAAYNESLWLEDLATYYAWRGDAAQAGVWSSHAFTVSPSGVQSWALGSELFRRARRDEGLRAILDGARADAWARVERISLREGTR
jgi:TolB-like protein/tetratricopeptide (TPR) repeat protein